MKMFNSNKLKLRSTTIDKFVPIVNIGAIGNGMVLEGRQVTCIVLDISERPDIEHLILNHKNINSGHAFSTWAINIHWWIVRYITYKSIFNIFLELFVYINIVCREIRILLV